MDTSVQLEELGEGPRREDALKETLERKRQREYSYCLQLSRLGWVLKASEVNIEPRNALTSPTCENAKQQINSKSPSSFTNTPMYHTPLPGESTSPTLHSRLWSKPCSGRSLLTPTVGLLLQDLRPHGQGSVDDGEPEGDQRHKVIELVGPVHHHAQDQDQEVETEQDLELGKNGCQRAATAPEQDPG